MEKTMEKTLGQQIDELQAEVDQMRLSNLQKEKAELEKREATAMAGPRMQRVDFEKLDPDQRASFLLKDKGEIIV